MAPCARPSPRPSRGPSGPAGARQLPPWSALGPGTEDLGTGEWLALLLGPPAERWEPCARAILRRRGLEELERAGVAELRAEFGLDAPRAARVVAAFALGRALARTRRGPRPRLKTPQEVDAELRPELAGSEHETFVALLLDGRHRLRRRVRVSVGTLTSSLVHPREVFRAAVRESAAAVIVAHNHPSGDPEPSAEDLAVTRRLVAVGRLLGIPLLDHVVVGAEGFVSLRERMDFERIAGDGERDQTASTVVATAAAASAAVSTRRT